MKYLSILFIMLGLACANNKNITKSDISSVNETDEISLSRTACFGTCPIYDLKIDASGNVFYNGKAYVENIGTFEGKINKENLKDLFNKLKNYTWAAYPSKYPIDNVDFPGFRLTYSTNEITKEVIANSNAAEELKALAQELDLLIKNVQLIKIEE